MIMNVKRNLTAKQIESGNVVIGDGWTASGDYKKNIKNIIYESMTGCFSACCVRGGFTMGPDLGKLTSKLIVKGKTSFPIEAFDVNRVTNHS